MATQNQNGEFMMFNQIMISRNNDLMKCPLCSKVFENPVVLNNCSHRFCFKCLNNVNVLKCPTCDRGFNEDQPFVKDNAFASVIKLAKEVNKHSSSQSLDVPNSIECEIFNLVLWPDASVYNLPIHNCIKHPRYLRLSGDTTVAHLIEFLFIRLETEGNSSDARNKYKIELTNVIRERENVDQSCLPKRGKLIPTSSHGENEVLKFPKNNLMISIQNPFTPLHFKLTAQELIEEYWIDLSRPLKLLFRLVEFDL